MILVICSLNTLKARPEGGYDARLRSKIGFLPLSRSTGASISLATAADTPASIMFFRLYNK